MEPWSAPISSTICHHRSYSYSNTFALPWLCSAEIVSTPADELRAALEHMGSDPVAAAAFSTQLHTVLHNILQNPTSPQLR